MDLNLAVYSTEQLENILTEKLKKVQTETVQLICEALKGEIQSRKERVK